MFPQACHNEYLFSSLYNVFLLSDSLYESNVQIQELKFAIGSQFPKNTLMSCFLIMRYFNMERTIILPSQHNRCESNPWMLCLFIHEKKCDIHQNRTGKTTLRCLRQSSFSTISCRLVVIVLTPTPNGSWAVEAFSLCVLLLPNLREVPHGTKGTGPRFITRPVYLRSQLRNNTNTVLL